MKISEIFYSLQGEGTHTGRAAIFIRFYGCNMSCPFCDEPLHQNYFEEQAESEIIEQLAQYPSKFVIITGGEPSIQNLNGFIQVLQKKGYYIAVESNGFNFENIKSANWITYSPKNWKHVQNTNMVAELKFVVHTTSDMTLLEKAVEQFEGPVYIQPEGKGQNIVAENVKFCIEFIQQKPRFQLSLQTHKLLNIP